MSRPITQTVVVAVAISLAMVTCDSAQAQFGRLEFGGGIVPNNDAPAGAIISTNVIIVPSQSQKSVSGYSDAVGEWDDITVEPHSEHGIRPIVSANVAVVPGKRHLHAYGAETGKWATLEVEEGVDTSRVTVSQTRATLLTATHFHVFSSASGRWASLDLTKE